MQTEGRARIGAQVRAYLRKNASKRRRHLTPLPLYYTPNTNNKCPNEYQRNLCSQPISITATESGQPISNTTTTNRDRKRACLSPQDSFRTHASGLVLRPPNLRCDVFLHCLEVKRGKQKVGAKKNKNGHNDATFGREPRFSLSSSLRLSLSPSPSLSFPLSLSTYSDEWQKKKSTLHQRAALGLKSKMGGLYDTQDSVLATEETRRAHPAALQSMNQPSRFLL